MAFYKPYAERYIGMLADLLENPPEDTPGWHASEFETSLMMAMRPELVRMDRAVHTRAGRPAWLPESFVKLDGAPDVEFQGYQYFSFPMDHEEWTPVGRDRQPAHRHAGEGRDRDRALRRSSGGSSPRIREVAGGGAYPTLGRESIILRTM